MLETMLVLVLVLVIVIVESTYITPWYPLYRQHHPQRRRLYRVVSQVSCQEGRAAHIFCSVCARRSSWRVGRVVREEGWGWRYGVSSDRRGGRWSRLES
jgi:hypothetical protein